jgi:hypothetical protein
MPEGQPSTVLAILGKAESAYAEFERQMRLLDEESKTVLKEQLEQIDHQRIAALRKKIGLA